MKNFAKKIITLALLAIILLPAAVLAQDGNESLNSKFKPAETQEKTEPPEKEKESEESGYMKLFSDEEKKKVQEKYTKYGCNSKGLNDLFKDANLCLTPEQKASNIYTILETPLETPEETAANSDGTLVKSCARFTQILNCAKSKITDQYLIEECPPESQIPGGSYGAVRGQDAKYSGDYYDCQPVTVILSPLEQGGVGFLNAYVGLIYRWTAGVIGVICVLIIIVSSIQIIAGQGEPSAIEEGKKRIFQAISGIALLFLASALLYIVNPTFFNPPAYQEQYEKITPKEMKTPPPTKDEVPIGAPKQVQIDATPPMN